MKFTQVWGELFSPIKPVDYHPFTCHPVLTSITGKEDKSPIVIVIITLSGVQSVLKASDEAHLLAIIKQYKLELFWAKSSSYYCFMIANRMGLINSFQNLIFVDLLAQ